jgi:cytochrome c biogenesis factor
MFLRLSALTSVFFDLHKRIHEETGTKIGKEWLKLLESNEEFRQKYNRKVWIKTFKFIVMATILILLGIISSYFIITDEPLTSMVIVVSLILVILFVSLTTFFQRLIRKKALDRILKLKRKAKLSNQNNIYGEN